MQWWFIIRLDGTALNYALDFSGGTATTVTFNEDMDIKQIDSEVTPVVEEVTGDKNVQPTKVVGTNQVVIKTRTLSQEEREKLDQALVEKFDVDDSLITTESISATVSSEMRRDAIVAVIVATLCMLVYIWFRFKISVLRAVRSLHFSMTFWLFLHSMHFQNFCR